jgi:4-hydroxybenzoate polyprenyltransferase/phosphoserine phosphatase
MRPESKKQVQSKASPPGADDPVPLVVDLDGTLTPADLSLEALLRTMNRNLFFLFAVIGWLLSGRAVAKALAARWAPTDGTTVPLNPGVVALIHTARADGRPVILATASHQRIADRIRKATGLFDVAIGSSNRRHVKGNGKLAALRAVLGDGPFDYIGDSPVDIPLWREARIGYSCRYQPPGISVVMVTDVVQRSAGAFLRALRPVQWAKNALVFVPLAAAGLVFDPSALLQTSIAAILFSLVASGIYQINDLLDIEADRAHPTKRNRPVAAGSLPAIHAMLLAAMLLLVSFAGAFVWLGPQFVLILSVYLILTTAYSLKLKAVMALDVIALGTLYTLRIVAGAVAANVAVSSWLFLFSVFFFLSLGYLKRFTELRGAVDPKLLLRGRGYVGGDLPVVAMLGVASGMVSILILALFITDEKATGDYASPLLLWGTLPCLLYWINRVWIMAYRGQVDGDPVAFAVRDARSIAVAGMAGACMIVARFIGVPMFVV